MSVRLHLFGPPRLVQPGGTLALSFERRSQLLAHLALHRTWVGRSEVAPLLWPETPLEQAHTNLRRTLFRLRTLPWAPAVKVQEQALGFDGTTDVADFESAIAQQRWADALEIAEGPLLAGFDDGTSEPWTDWLNAERERLHASRRLAAQQCLAAAGDPGEVLALSSRLLAGDPLDESALRAQMQAYLQQGHAARAREAYRAYAARLAEELGTAPSASLQALHDALVELGPGHPGKRLPLPAADAAPQLVGRVAEQRDVGDRLEKGCRLLCLIGPGGVGKSSLARQLSSALAARYADGSVFVPLEDVASADALGARLARELAVTAGVSGPLQAVIAFLRECHMLLVLDNFEHLQPAAAQLQALLDACPGLQVLVTSRVRLGLAAEQLLPLDGLPCPEPEDADCLEAFDAARLFVRAAQAVEPALRPAAEAPAIALICRLVDGLPLALEMAAAWTRVLSCSAIAAELRQGVALLTECGNGRPTRHASMATVFDQSWQRLSPIEQSTLARLTVFHGGFTPEAARSVAGATLPLLASLADQSLLRKSGSRADLHPLLRQLAADRLTDPEREATRAAHALHYLNGLVPLLAALECGDKQALQQVDVELENVRAAWRWTGTHGPATALRSAVLPLLYFCDLRGRYSEAIALLGEAASGIAKEDARVLALLDAATAELKMNTDHYAEAQALAERALWASRATRDHDTRLLCFKVLGGCALETGHLLLARRRYRQALVHAPAAIDPRRATGVLNNLAIVERQLGHYDAARKLYLQVLVERRRQRNPAGEAACLNNLALLELHCGEIAVAAAHFEASLALAERQGLKSMEMVVRTNLTELLVLRNDAAAARQHGERALELAVRMDAKTSQSLVHLQLARLAVQQRDCVAARAALRAAVEITIAVDSKILQLDSVLYFAELLAAEGETGAASRLLRYVIDHPATVAPTRETARSQIARWASSDPDVASVPAPAIDLWTLLHRIVDETPFAHAPLIESLRNGRLT